MGEKKNNNNLNESPVTRWLRNAVLGATMADLPAMMTASGWRLNEKGNYVLDQQNDPHVILLRDNLAAEGIGVMLGEFGIPAIHGLYNLGVRGLAKSGNNWARAKSISKEMNNIIDEGLQYFGKVKYYGPTMGKTTAAKTNPDLVDFDDFTREAKNNLAKELNISSRMLQSDPKYALAYLEMLERELDRWRRNSLNTNKTLVISKKSLADKNVYNNEPSIPDRQTFILRLRNRGETDDANSNDWYNMLFKLNPNLKIDNRFISEIEYNPHYIEVLPNYQQKGMNQELIKEKALTVLNFSETMSGVGGLRNLLKTPNFKPAPEVSDLKRGSIDGYYLGELRFGNIGNQYGEEIIRRLQGLGHDPSLFTSIFKAGNRTVGTPLHFIRELVKKPIYVYSPRVPNFSNGSYFPDTGDAYLKASNRSTPEIASTAHHEGLMHGTDAIVDLSTGGLVTALYQTLANQMRNTGLLQTLGSDSWYELRATLGLAIRNAYINGAKQRGIKLKDLKFEALRPEFEKSINMMNADDLADVLEDINAYGYDYASVLRRYPLFLDRFKYLLRYAPSVVGVSNIIENE